MKSAVVYSSSATASGPAIFSASLVHSKMDETGPGAKAIADYNTLLAKAAEQLMRRGIVLRGQLPLRAAT